MSEQPVVLVPARPVTQEIVLMPVIDSTVPAESVTSVSPEQVHAREAVFTQQAQHEQQQVMGLIGMWTGALLLHDLALEHFEGRDEEEQQRPPRLKQEEDEPE